jgi:hypothetical protein
MASNIQTNITADSTQQRAQLALAQADLKAYAAAVRAAAQDIQSSGVAATADQTVALEKAAVGYNTSKAAITGYKSALAGGASATGAMSAAVRVETEAMNSNGVAREAMVLAHEMMQGRFTRVGGSLMVMAERMGNASFMTMGLVGAFALAAMGAYHLVEWLDKVATAKMTASIGAVDTGITQAQAAAAEARLRGLAGVTADTSGKIVSIWAQTAGMTAPIMGQMTDDLENFAQRTGTEALQAANKFKEAFGGDLNAATELMRATGATDGAIRAMQNAITSGNQPIEMRNILLAQLNQFNNHVEDSSYLATKALESQANETVMLAGASALGGGTALPAAVEAAPDTSALDRQQRFLAAMASINAEMKSPAAQSWSAQTDLALQKATLTTEQAAHAQGQTWQQIHAAMAATTVTFWQQQVQQTAAGTANNEEAQKHLLAAQESVDMQKVRLDAGVAKQSLEAQLSSLTAQQAAYHDNFTIVMQLEQQKVDLLRAAGAKETTQLNMELKRQTDLVRQHTQEVFQLAEQEISRQEGINREQLSAQRETLDDQVALGQMTKSKQLAAELVLTEQLYQEDLKRLQNLEATLSQEPADYAKVAAQILALTAKNTADMEKLHTQAALQSEAAWKSAVAPIESSMDGLFNNMLHGQMTVSNAMLQAAGNMIEGYAKLALKDLEDWTVKQLAKLTVTETTQDAQTMAVIAGGTAQVTGTQMAAAAGAAVSKTAGATTIMQDAYKAAAGTWSAVAQIPYVGPYLAPAAAAAAFVAVMAFDVFDVGTSYVPNDMLAMVHQGEIIAPASMSDSIRSGEMTLGGGSSSSGGGSAGGDTYEVHMHGPFVQAIDTQTGAAFLAAQMPLIAKRLGVYMTRNPSLRPTY